MMRKKNKERQREREKVRVRKWGMAVGDVDDVAGAHSPSDAFAPRYEDLEVHGSCS